MSGINKDEAKVIMSLADYEKLASYEKAYKEMLKELRALGYIDLMTSEEIVVVLESQKVQDYIVPLLGRDCELENYPDGIDVRWK